MAIEPLQTVINLPQDRYRKIKGGRIHVFENCFMFSKNKDDKKNMENRFSSKFFFIFLF